MSIKIKDATPIDVLQDYLMLPVGNTDEGKDGKITLGQVKEYVDADKATVAFTGSYLNLTDTPNLESYVQMATLQQNYYNKNQINQLIDSVSGPVYEKVDELPEEGKNNVIYLVKQEGVGEDNTFDEYIWIPDGKLFEKIGNTRADFNNYYTIEEVDNLIPSVSNATITLQQGGVTKGTFTLNQFVNTVINLDEGGDKQVQSDWNEDNPSEPSFIQNKPEIPSNTRSLLVTYDNDTTETIVVYVQ